MLNPIGKQKLVECWLVDYQPKHFDILTLLTKTSHWLQLDFCHFYLVVIFFYEGI